MLDLNPITSILNKLNTVSLQQINNVELMNRRDTKFVFNTALLPELLTELMPFYNILMIDNIRLYPYTTDYYDTDDLKMYYQHQNGKLNRYKFRFRSYDAFNKNFLELKFKSNKSKTLKKRIEICDREAISYEAVSFLDQESPMSFEDLSLKLENKFDRITLVNKEMTERLTIDLNLSFSNSSNIKKLDHLAIAELKQDIFIKSNSSFTVIMKKRGIRSLSISKYCLGMLLLNPEIKQNTFKAKLLLLKKIIAN